MTERPAIQQNPTPRTDGLTLDGWALPNRQDTRVTVGVVLCLGRVDPVVLSQHIEVQLHEHGRQPRRSRLTHEGVEDSKGKEVVAEVGGALERQDNVGQVGEGVGPDDRGTTAGYLWKKVALD